MTDDLYARLTAALADRYAIESKLGEGGMATVYLAGDLKHDRKVAIKVLKPELAAVIGGERFVTEIKTTAALQHPNILPLYDSGVADSFLYYVMPFVEGESLRAKLDRDTQLGVDEAVQIAKDVADALDYAHQHGVIHRDIKPENILMQGGRPVVADFGIALAVSAAGGGRMTETGLSLGTPHYMSPEQATAEKDLNNRSDIYALGCVLYEMLTGDPPHTGPSSQAVIMRILTEDPRSVTAMRRSVPPHVSAAVQRAIEKLPADRFESAAEFRAALDNTGFTHVTRVRSAASAPSAAGGDRSAGRWQLIAIAASIVAVLGVVFGVTAGLGGNDSSDPVLRFEIAPLAENPLTLGPTAARWFAVSPGGERIVFFDGAGASTGVFYIREMGSFESRELSGTLGGRDVVFSPEGDWIAYAIGAELYTRPVQGGSAVRLAEGLDGGRIPIAWLDDGSIVYEGGGNAFVRIPASGGGEPDTIVSYADMSGLPLQASPLPGSRGILATVCPNGSCPSNGADLHIVDLEARTSEIVLNGVLAAWYVDSGHVIYVRIDGAVFATDFDPGSLSFGGVGIPLMEGVRTVATAADIDISRDGTVLYVIGDAAASAQATFLPMWVNRDGVARPVDPSLGPATYQNPALSGDATRLAIGVVAPGEAEELWVKELPDGPFNILTDDPGRSRRPVWIRDDSLIAFTVNLDGGVRIQTIRSDGSTTGIAEDLLRLEGRDVFEVSFTPDESQAVFRQGNANLGQADLGIYNFETDTETSGLLASENNERAISLSPDGRWLAYVSDVTGRDEVFVRPFPDARLGRRQVSTDGGREPQWSSTGEELFYRDAEGWMVAARVEGDAGFNVFERTRLFDASDYRVDLAWHNYAVSPNDQEFLMLRFEQAAPDAEQKLILIRNFLTEVRERTGG